MYDHLLIFIEKYSAACEIYVFYRDHKSHALVVGIVY